jgi:acetone carboxylase gamma subunit
MAIFCARCDHPICDATESYKDHCRQSHTAVADLPRGVDPAEYGMTMFAELRQYCCPACGVLVESEVAIEGSPVLRDVEIAPATLAEWSEA